MHYNISTIKSTSLKREFKGGVEITTIRAPYRILKRYNNSRYSTSIKQFEVNVPEKILKNP
jgi:hypothetical protein